VYAGLWPRTEGPARTWSLDDLFAFLAGGKNHGGLTIRVVDIKPVGNTRPDIFILRSTKRSLKDTHSIGGSKSTFRGS
jgi:hypothetical protein